MSIENPNEEGENTEPTPDQASEGNKSLEEVDAPLEAFKQEDIDAFRDNLSKEAEELKASMEADRQAKADDVESLSSDIRESMKGKDEVSHEEPHETADDVQEIPVGEELEELRERHAKLQQEKEVERGDASRTDIPIADVQNRLQENRGVRGLFKKIKNLFG